jgi:hypothetical protein
MGLRWGPQARGQEYQRHRKAHGQKGTDRGYQDRDGEAGRAGR